MSKHEHEKTKIITPELCPSFLHAREYYQDEPDIQKINTLSTYKIIKNLSRTEPGNVFGVSLGEQKCF